MLCGQSRRVPLAASLIALLAGCGGGDGGSGSSFGGATVEVTDSRYVNLSGLPASGSSDMTYVLLDGQSVQGIQDVTLTHANAQISGSLLQGTNLNSASFLNPADGEYSRVVRISGDNLFGAVGLEVLSGNLPSSGTVSAYNSGWVGVTASVTDNVYVLEGDAFFNADWGTNDVDALFTNFSGTDRNGASVSGVGTIVVNDAAINGDRFSGGSVSGDGEFDGLGGTGSTRQISGVFFGPEADELGGVLVIDDPNDDILVVGAFQAD